MIVARRWWRLIQRALLLFALELLQEQQQMILAPRWLRFLERVVLPVAIELMTPAPGWWQKIERALLQRVQQQMAPAYRWWQDVEQALRQPSTACLLLFLAGYVCAWQVGKFLQPLILLQVKPPAVLNSGLQQGHLRSCRSSVTGCG